MRFFLLLVVALAGTVVWQTTIGASPQRVGCLDNVYPVPSFVVTFAGPAVTLSA
jgi:ABC-type xylose transport system permease subunit